MLSPLQNQILRKCLFICLSLFIFSSAFCQESQADIEIDEAITNAQNGNCEAAIPILKKYADRRDFNDFGILDINVNLNLCYLLTENKAIDVNKVNVLTEKYFSKYGISKIDRERSEYEMGLLYVAGMINGAVGNDEKMLFFLLIIKNYYSEEKLVGDKLYVNVLSALTLGYNNIFDYKSAIDVGQIALNLNYELFGETNEISLKLLNLLYSAYKKINNPLLARVCLEKMISIGVEIFGEKDPRNLSNLIVLARLYSELGEYQEAVKLIINIVDICKEVFGENNPDYVQSLESLALVYFILGDYQNALEIYLQAVELGEKVFGVNNPEYFASLSGLASIYSANGDYKKSLEIKLEVSEKYNRLLGEKHPDYLKSLNDLATEYLNLGDHKKALEMNMKVLKVYFEVYEENHPDYLTSMGQLALTYSALGEYKKALEIELKIADIQKELLGEKDLAYLFTLNNLASSYSDIGDYLNALEIGLKVVQLRKEVLSEMHPVYLTSLSNLASYYAHLGDHLVALEIYQKVISVQKKVLGEKHSDYISNLSSLAVIYSDLDEYSKALEIYLKVVELHEKILGEKHPDYLRSLSNLAGGYSDLNDSQKALEIFGKVVEIGKGTWGESHPYYLNSLINLAYSYSKLGNYQKSLELNLNANKLLKEVLGDNHPDFLLSLSSLAFTEIQLSKGNSALSHYRQMLNKKQEYVTDYFNLMTEHQRVQFWKQNSNSFIIFPMFLEKAVISNHEETTDAYNFALFAKGLLLNTTIDFDRLINDKGTPEAIAKFEELKLLKLQIQRISEKPIAERYLNVDSLENIAQKKETELVKLSKEYGDYTRNLKITWKDVQEKLLDKDVAIEFVEYPTLTDTVKYAALVLRKGWQYPRMIPLFRKDQIEEFISQEENYIYSNHNVGKQIKKLVWEPLEEVIAPGERVYFSPAGILHQLAIENLPASDSTTLEDRYQLYRLSSTKELVIRNPAPKYQSAVLYGGLEYELDEDKMLAESHKYEYEKSRSYQPLRGYSDSQEGWESIGGTLLEVEDIGQKMQEKQYPNSIYTGSIGNEESFKSLSGKNNSIIHIATHGFFSTIEESKETPFIMQRLGDQQQDKPFIDPMLRSGLIMAGGNKAWLGEKVPDNIEDGVLTAREISHMDLRGTDLVVLSACETGLGEVSSEGVFGLQRSFKQAGVQTIMMSLWEVNDLPTRYMMTEFYSNLLNGKEKREAFLEAKRKCRDKYPEPENWAAFIMLN